MLAHVNAVLLMWHYTGNKTASECPGNHGDRNYEDGPNNPSGRWRHEFIEERHRQGKRHPEKDD